MRNFEDRRDDLKELTRYRKRWGNYNILIIDEWLNYKLNESEQSCLFRKFESPSFTWDTGNVDSRRFGWLSSLEDELLYRRLCILSEDNPELPPLLIMDGYR